MDLTNFLLTFVAISAVVVGDFADGGNGRTRLRTIFQRRYHGQRQSPGGSVRTVSEIGGDETDEDDDDRGEGGRGHVFGRGTTGVIPSSRNASQTWSTGGRFKVYRSEIETKLQRADTPEDFLAIFYPHSDVDTIWKGIVNSSYDHREQGLKQHGPQVGLPALYEDVTTGIKGDLTQHMQEMSCSHSKPVTIDMYEELNITRNQPVYIVPECTTVMRCQNNDCCSRVKPCIPRDGTRIMTTKTFLITELTLFSHNDVLEASPSIRLVNYTFAEDTICDCLGTASQPSCDLTCDDTSITRLNQRDCRCECIKKCPHPFTQDDDTCACECQDDNIACKKTKRGKRPISNADCSCVASGKCYPPPCRKGFLFSSHLCLCITKDLLTDSRNYHAITTTGQTDTSKDEKTDGKCATQVSEANESAPSLSYSSFSDNPRTDNSREEGTSPLQVQDSEEDKRDTSGRTL